SEVRGKDPMARAEHELEQYPLLEHRPGKDNDPRHEEVGCCLDQGHLADMAGAPELGKPPDAAHVALVPPYSLAKKPTVAVNALLVDVGIGRRGDPPTVGDQPQSQVEILGERPAPGLAVKALQSSQP